MNLEQRVDQLERQNKRQRIGLLVLAVALCGVVSMAATDSRDGEFDTVFAKSISIMGDGFLPAVSLGVDDGGDGFIYTRSARGKKLVALLPSVDGEGSVITYSPNGKKLVELDATVNGEGRVITYSSTGKKLVKVGATGSSEGLVTTYSPTGNLGKKLVELGATGNGGGVQIFNKTGENIITLGADDYGNGEVGVWNRKGKGRLYDSK